jgi:hypothetical protein
MADITKAVFGLQDNFIISGIPAGANESLLGHPLIGQALTVAGVYTCRARTDGIQNVEVHIKASAFTGTVTPAFISTFLDGTAKQTATLSAISGTAQNASLTLVGEKKCVFTLTLAAASSVTMSRAEINGL